MDSIRTLFTEHDTYLFKEGKHVQLYEKLGAHRVFFEEKEGTFFAVWAPNAQLVSVTGDFNGWNDRSHPLRERQDSSGIWEGFIPGLTGPQRYKYHIRSRHNKYRADKGDPFGIYWESPPGTSSIVWDLDYEWGDGDWIEKRGGSNGLDAPISIYEIHLGSWRRNVEDGNRFLTYREIAPYLVKYTTDLGFTHVEFLPVMEHPFYGSWGYQTVGYFAPTSRYGSPQDFMYLIDQLHQAGIGVILDWVPSHFPDDIHGLVFFDGTHLYEHADRRQGFHPQWHSNIFNYGRNEVKAFLKSSAHFWLDRYHADGLRIDAVASMLYLDYGRNRDEWIPNRFGGKENLDAIDFLKELHEGIYRDHPDVQTIAEESTAWPFVTKPGYLGGLGFGMKWNMGWMHDTLAYLKEDPLLRKYNHDRLTFTLWYAFNENFVLSLSHDEVTYGKGSLLGKMPGDEWGKYANLKLLFGYMYAHPGKKLLFMGSEFGQWREWSHEESLDWHLLQYPFHTGIREWLRDLNCLYRTEPALFEGDFAPETFEWVDFRDSEQSIISFIRRGRTTASVILVVCNFTPVPRLNYRVGVPMGGYWKELLNSDGKTYGGAGYGNFGGVEAAPVPAHGRYNSLSLTLPPLSTLFFKSG